MRDKPLVHLIIPKWGGTGIHQTFGHRMPPMALLVLAAHARRAGWEPRVIDQNFQKIPDETPDLACLTVWTSIAPQAYRLADAYRAKGVPVVLGGVHASLLPVEALRHCDSVVSGEADTIFGTVLNDAARGGLQRQEVQVAHRLAFGHFCRAWAASRTAARHDPETPLTRGIEAAQQEIGAGQ